MCAFSGRADWVAHLYCKLIIPPLGVHRKNVEGFRMQKLDTINTGELYDEPLSLMNCAKNRRMHETTIQKINLTWPYWLSVGNEDKFVTHMYSRHI